jgi:hypothetical protein
MVHKAWCSFVDNLIAGVLEGTCWLPLKCAGSAESAEALKC